MQVTGTARLRKRSKGQARFIPWSASLEAKSFPLGHVATRNRQENNQIPSSSGVHTKVECVPVLQLWSMAQRGSDCEDVFRPSKGPISLFSECDYHECVSAEGVLVRLPACGGLLAYKRVGGGGGGGVGEGGEKKRERGREGGGER